ncbi:MAG: hypothetical protein ACR2PL_22015, partial [Dehalococcoidia bacterium]
MTRALQRKLVAGGAAGLLGGIVFAWALQAQGMMAQTAGIVGLRSVGAGLLLHLLISVVLGAGFGAIVEYQPRSYAALSTGGVLYGLLWWIAGPLTLTSLLEG